MNDKQVCEKILETSKKNNEYFNIYIKPPIHTSPKDIVLEAKGIRIKSNLGDAVIPYAMLEKVTSAIKRKED